MKCKVIISLAFFVLLFSCNIGVDDATDSNSTEVTTPDGQYNLIKDGIGIDNIVINQSKKSDVIATYGNNFELITHGTYSYEMKYSGLNLSFYYMYDDVSEEIFCIKISAPYKGKTSKGIVLGVSTMQDVINIYGAPSWMTTTGGDFWGSYYTGIELKVEKDKSLPEYPLNVDAHINKTINQIVIRLI